MTLSKHNTNIEINTDAFRTPSVEEAAPMMQQFVGAPPAGRPNPAPMRPATAPAVREQNNLHNAYQNGAMPDNIGDSEPDFKRGGMANGGVNSASWFARSEEKNSIHPEGLITSAGAGRTDIHPINVPSGSFVLPADIVSGLGEGNTLAGASVMDRMMHSNPYGIEGGGRHGGGMGIPHASARPFREEGLKRGGKPQQQSGVVPIVVAGGEMLYHPETIIKKFGSLKKGHAALDQFVKKVRVETAKTLKKLPGPKT